MSLQRAQWEAKETDVKEIVRISQKKSVTKVSRAVLEGLDRDMLSRMISAYLVLKANGHSDNDFGHYLATKETQKTLKLGLSTASALLPSLIIDGEFRSLVMRTRKYQKQQRRMREEKRRQTQQKLAEKPKNVAKLGSLTVTYKAQQ